MLLGLGLTWTKDRPEDLYYNSVKLTARKHINHLLDTINYSHAKHRELPHDPGAKLSKSQCPNETEFTRELLDMQKRYRHIVGTYIWINGTVRVDIGWIVLILCSFMSNPGWEHYQAALQVARYLAGTVDLGITYRIVDDFNVRGYVDADHASHEDRKSIYSYIFTLAGAPFAWKVGFQTRISLSTAESEVRAIAALREAVKHLLYLKKVFHSIMLPEQSNSAHIAMATMPIQLLEDNGAAVRYAYNPASQSSMKYLETDIYWINDYIRSGDLKITKIKASEQLADIGTKPNLRDTFMLHRNRLLS